MTVLSDRVDALEATNATLVAILNGLKGTLQAAADAGQGPQGWSPVLTVQTDGNRLVYQITDWTGGGTGATKPDVGDYVGSAGLVATAAEAIDVRGAVGLTGQSAYEQWEAIPANNGQTFDQFIDALSAQAVSATAANKTDAETAKSAAETARDLAQKWSSEIEDTVVSGGLYSALHHAAKAAASAGSAASILTTVQTIFDNFDDRYLGPFSTANEPALDNDGDALQVGAIYLNTDEDELRFWNGVQWKSPEATAEAAAAAALASQTAAATSATNAGTSETNAGLSEGKAAQWAEEVEDTEVTAGKYSALHHARKAQAAALAASVASNAVEWVSGGAFTAGDSLVWSPLNFLAYRAKTDHSGITTDPSADTTNWVLAASTGAGVMQKADYDSDDDGKVNAAVTADQVPWSGVQSKPSFATVATSGSYADLNNKPTLGTAAAAATGDFATAAQGTKADNAIQTTGDVKLTGGIGSDYEWLGDIYSGTVTPEIVGAGKENFKALRNYGAFKLAKPTSSIATTIRIRVINAASAGVINVSDFDKVSGDYETTDGKEYWFFIDHDNARRTLTISEIV